MKENNPVLWNTHQQFMAKALVLAEQALEEGEIPVGACCSNG